MPSPRRLLVIDDDRLFCDIIRDHLGKEGLEVFTAQTGAEGIESCTAQDMDIVLLDQNLPDAEGHTLCPSILAANDRTKIIFITAHASFEGAVKAIKAGAYDYLSKPFELDELTLAITKAAQTQELEKIAGIGEYKTGKEKESAVLIGSSGLTETNHLIQRAADSQAPVLITGETGTGKNVVARALHFRSNAREEAFLTINCAAIPENLIEAELFGYEKGAFTGASGTRRGIFEMADGGTLLLDEIGAMPLHLQAKLLSVLEDRKVRRLGGMTAHSVNVRVVAATNADLEGGLGTTFRSDLYYRLSVIRIHLPPLRQRREDIPELCTFLLDKISGGRCKGLSPGELSRLKAYDWPGNVRELRNILERAWITQTQGELCPSCFISGPEHIPHAAGSPHPSEEVLTLEQMEKNHIRHALGLLSGNYTATARQLGISLSTLKRKIKTYGLK